MNDKYKKLLVKVVVNMLNVYTNDKVIVALNKKVEKIHEIWKNLRLRIFAYKLESTQ